MNDDKEIRPPEVTEAQHRHLIEHPACEISGATTNCQAHHIMDYAACKKMDMIWLASDPRNFVTLREFPGFDFHLVVGHLLSFFSINLHVIECIVGWKGWTEQQIRADPKWIAMKAARAKPVHQWTDDDTASMKEAAIAMFPTQNAG